VKHKMEGKILVADDERVNVEFFELMLSKLGFSVVAAYDGEEVLKKLEDFRPDLILLDLLMPRLNGLRVIEKLKKDDSTKDIPIIVLSAVSDVDKKVDLLELGIDDYIIKPFNFIEILARIRSVLRSKAYRDELCNNEKRIRVLKEFEESLESFFTDTCSDSREIIEYIEKNRETEAGGMKLLQKVIEREEKLIHSVDNLRKRYTGLMSREGY